MIFFIAPAKTFTETEKPFKRLPVFVDKSKKIVEELRKYSIEELSSLMKIKENLAKVNHERYENFSFEEGVQPAIFAYHGIQYKALDVSTLDDSDIEYLDDHLRILSGLYGSVRALDGIRPYRLEMHAKLPIGNFANLYDFWSEDIYNELEKNAKVFINLASAEYSKTIKKYLKDEIYVSCSFKVEKDGKLRTSATPAKQARGKMVRFLAKNKVEDYREIKKFDLDGYVFREDLSSEDGQFIEYVFVK